MSNEHEYLEKNDQALADNIAALREEYDQRILALEAEISAMKGQIQGQTQVIGESLQAVWGSGSTVTDPNPEDKR